MTKLYTLYCRLCPWERKDASPNAPHECPHCQGRSVQYVGFEDDEEQEARNLIERTREIWSTQGAYRPYRTGVAMQPDGGPPKPHETIYRTVTIRDEADLVNIGSYRLVAPEEAAENAKDLPPSTGGISWGRHAWVSVIGKPGLQHRIWRDGAWHDAD